MTQIKNRTGKVMIFDKMIKNGRGGWKKAYRTVLVKEDRFGNIFFNAETPETTHTTDGYVTLPEEYRDQIRWDD